MYPNIERRQLAGCLNQGARVSSSDGLLKIAGGRQRLAVRPLSRIVYIPTECEELAHSSTPKTLAKSNMQITTQVNGHLHETEYMFIQSKKVSTGKCPQQRYMMDEDTDIHVPPLHTPKQNDRYDHTLRELDQAVSSLAKQRLRRSRRESNDAKSISSNTINTQDGQSICSQRNMINNMDEIRQCRSPGSGSRSEESSTRRKRGDSLERSICDTVLESAAWGGSLYAASHEESDTEPASIEFILQDLEQAESVLEFETSSVSSRSSSRSQRSTRSSRSYRNSTKKNNLRVLPPLLSMSLDGEEKTGTVPSMSKANDSSEAAITPDTSIGTSKSSMDLDQKQFMELDDKSFPALRWPEASPRKRVLSMKEGCWNAFDKTPFSDDSLDISQSKSSVEWFEEDVSSRVSI